MSHRFRIGLLVFTILVGVALAWGVVRATPTLANSAGQSRNSILATPTALPEKPASVLVSPEVSLIDSPTPSCVLPKSNTGVCYLTWYYMYADATPNYMITMTLSIDDHPRARYNGFFQNYMYVPSELMTFKVPCGAPGVSGIPGMGATHTYVLRARDSASLQASNSGSVLCPADLPPRTYLPMVRR